jgi:hypothetical protein
VEPDGLALKCMLNRKDNNDHTVPFPDWLYVTEAAETEKWRTILRSTDYTLTGTLLSFYYSTPVTFQEMFNAFQ